MTCVGVPNGVICINTNPIIEIEVNGKIMLFEEEHMFPKGYPRVLRRDGEVAKRQPNEKHPFWDAHSRWVAGGKRLGEHNRAIL